MQIDLSKEDIKMLKSILKKDHRNVNSTSIKDCALSGTCWYRKMIYKLKGKEILGEFK